MSPEAAPSCWVDPRLEAEFPGLAVAARLYEGPVEEDPGVIERLGAIASRIRGRTAIEMRRETVPAAYRAFYRQVGVDPDVEMTPVEAAIGRRLFDGGVKVHGALHAALELAVLETGVPVYGFDAAGLRGSPGIRTAEAQDEVVGESGLPGRSPGRLLIADDEGPLCWLFDEPRGRAVPPAQPAALLLLAVGVPGVASMVLDEALDVACGALGA